MEQDTPAARPVWDAALGELQLLVSRANYETWLKDTVGLEVEGDLFVIGAPTAFATEWLDKRLGDTIRQTLGGILGRPVGLRFVVHQEPPAADDWLSFSPDGLAQLRAGSAPPLPAPEPTPAAPVPAAPPAPMGAPLQPKYTFDRFIVGNNNQFAHAVAQRVAQEPGRAFNPLFLYGGVGLGKTHLLHAIGHESLAKGLLVMYVTSEQFTNEFISAIQNRRTEEFRQKYRTTDVLLIDDIQFIAGKEQTQESFFHIFNDLHGANRQIVVTSDRPPKLLHLLEDRLRSRFEWGLQADVQAPDFETRVAILRAKAEELGIAPADGTLEVIAQRFNNNIRELEGALNRVLAYASITKAPVTPELAERALAGIAPAAPAEAPRVPLTAARLLEITAGYFRIDGEALRGPRRTKDLVTARHIAMYLLREELGLPLTEIGRELGGRDHTTVLHGFEKVASDAKRDPNLRRALSDIKALLQK